MAAIRLQPQPGLTGPGENVGSQIAADPLTAHVPDAPRQHDGATPLTFELRFSDDVTISVEDMRDHALNVTGGTVTDAAMLDERTDRWEITVTPSGTEYMFVSIPPTGSCSDAGALCAAYGFRLQNGITFVVAYAPPVVPLTAEFTDVPDEHGGSSAFTLRLAFSEAIRNSYRKLRDDLLSATGGTVTRASRVDRRNDLWEIEVEPSGNGPVTVTLTAGGRCATAPCTADGRALSEEVSAARAISRRARPTSRGSGSGSRGRGGVWGPRAAARSRPPWR